jgi:parvulin-like peptidyl-prolyl isomerase
MTSVTRMQQAERIVCLAVITASMLWAAQPVAAQSPPVARPVQASKPKPAATAPAAPAPATQGAASAKTADDVVARVGATDITADDIRGYVAALAPREQAALAKDPALFSQAVRMLLANQLVVQEAVAKKWDQQPNVAAQLDRVRENALAELYLQSVTVPPANYPSEEDVQKVYDANQSALLVPRQFQLAQIFVAVQKDADKASEDKAKKKVDDIQRRLKASGADFAAIQTAENDARDGGDLGWVADGQIRPEIQGQVIGLAKGAISDSVKLEDGWHILKLIDTRAAYTRTLPEVRDQLVQQMRAERATMLRRAYLAELLKQHPPAVNELALSKMLGEQNQAVR